MDINYFVKPKINLNQAITTNNYLLTYKYDLHNVKYSIFSKVIDIINN